MKSWILQQQGTFAFCHFCHTTISENNPSSCPTGEDNAKEAGHTKRTRAGDVLRPSQQLINYVCPSLWTQTSGHRGQFVGYNMLCLEAPGSSQTIKLHAGRLKVTSRNLRDSGRSCKSSSLEPKRPISTKQHGPVWFGTGAFSLHLYCQKL